MIQIIPIDQFSRKEVIKDIPAEILPFTTELSNDLLQLIASIHAKYPNYQSLPISEEGLFVVLKKGKIIGYGSVIASPNTPLTAGIGLLNHCFIIPLERQKGYGNQLFQHLRQYAALHYGLLQISRYCPLWNQMGEYIELDK